MAMRAAIRQSNRSRYQQQRKKTQPKQQKAQPKRQMVSPQRVNAFPPNMPNQALPQYPQPLNYQQPPQQPDIVQKVSWSGIEEIEDYSRVTEDELQVFSPHEKIQPKRRRHLSKNEKLVLYLCIGIAVLYGISAFLQLSVFPRGSQEPSPTPTVMMSRSTPTSTPIPTIPKRLAVLGGKVSDFTKLLGHPDTESDLNTSVEYQPYGDGFYKFYLAVTQSTDNTYRVNEVDYQAHLSDTISWDAGTKLCQSFLPNDAVYKSDQDFGGQYQQIYISKSLAHEFPESMFQVGRGSYPTLATPGTVQISYTYTYSFFSKEIELCNVSIGQPY